MSQTRILKELNSFLMSTISLLCGCWPRELYALLKIISQKLIFETRGFKICCSNKAGSHQPKGWIKSNQIRRCAVFPWFSWIFFADLEYPPCRQYFYTDSVLKLTWECLLRLWRILQIAAIDSKYMRCEVRKLLTRRNWLFSRILYDIMAATSHIA